MYLKFGLVPMNACTKITPKSKNMSLQPILKLAYDQKPESFLCLRVHLQEEYSVGKLLRLHIVTTMRKLYFPPILFFMTPATVCIKFTRVHLYFTKSAPLDFKSIRTIQFKVHKHVVCTSWNVVSKFYNFFFILPHWKSTLTSDLRILKGHDTVSNCQV